MSLATCDSVLAIKTEHKTLFEIILDVSDRLFRCGDLSVSKNNNLDFLATFLRLGTLFCSPKAEIGFRTTNYLRFCTAIHDRGSPQQSLIEKKLQTEQIFCF